ncbi:histone-lysine N-methyltransferase PRDM9-like [Engraulis encrasicolus]|uniref:histone-lysine N-methyltransferase PRDM9-like n=1 Tax=Engraulis encrasicolus TaxID=184585 RepID=UPI002FD27791
MSSSDEESLERLSVYFSTSEWSQLSFWEKKRYKRMKRNYLFMQSIGLSSQAPEFMRKRGGTKRQRATPPPLTDSSDSEEEEWTPSMERPRPASRSSRPPTRVPTRHTRPQPSTSHSDMGSGDSQAPQPISSQGSWDSQAPQPIRNTTSQSQTINSTAQCPQASGEGSAQQATEDNKQCCE